MDMHVNKAVTRLAYRIEEKPEGGFIARSDQPGMEAVEGATREEVVKKLEDLLVRQAGVPEGLNNLLGATGLNLKISKSLTVARANADQALTSEEQKISSSFAGMQLQARQPQSPTTDFQSELGKSSPDTTGTILRV